jgi:hypothetical protein
VTLSRAVMLAQAGILDASVEFFCGLPNMSLDSLFFASPPKIC